MNRRAFLAALGSGVLGTRRLAGAQSRTGLHRIGLLTSRAFYAGNLPWLSEFGLVEGRDFALEVGQTADDRQLPAAARQLVGLPVDVIVTEGVAASRAAKAATGTIPIVMIVHGDPVTAGLVASLGQPGGNVTGMTLLVHELVGKRLELLRETVPSLARVGVLWNPASGELHVEWRHVDRTSRALGLVAESLEIPGFTGLEAAFARATTARVDGLLVLTDRLAFGHAATIAELARRHRLPVIYDDRYFVTPFGGAGLMSYSYDRSEVSRRVAWYVARILRGARPADLPVEQPTAVELVVNLKAAKDLGLTIPPSLLARADKVFE